MGIERHVNLCGHWVWLMIHSELRSIKSQPPYTHSACFWRLVVVLTFNFWLCVGGTRGARWWRPMRTCFTSLHCWDRLWILGTRPIRWSTWPIRTVGSSNSVMKQGSRWSSTSPTTQHSKSGWTTLEISGLGFTSARWSSTPGAF